MIKNFIHNFIHPLVEKYLKRILAVLGKDRWNISTLSFALSLQGIENKMNSFKPKGNLADFLKDHPENFCVTDTHVWSRAVQDAWNKEILENYEKQILALIGNDVWSIETLEEKLIEEGIDNFKAKGTLSNFLKNRPQLFCVTKTHVLSKEGQKAWIEEQIQMQEPEIENESTGCACSLCFVDP